MGNCRSSFGPTVPVMSGPLCFSTRKAVDSLLSPLELISLKLPVHFPVTSTSAATARAATAKRHSNVLMDASLGIITKDADESSRARKNITASPSGHFHGPPPVAGSSHGYTGSLAGR